MAGVLGMKINAEVLKEDVSDILEEMSNFDKVVLGRC